ncbi:hypothetical protein [Acrocarpospora catenulata]|uniref:hypothetical protein n=1 Tax=Acrocarpospora catenulata TaxID=2836182 RepID=UPI001BD9B649|nr:hypothetical protein [Acrocarpospora catenulata]
MLVLASAALVAGTAAALWALPGQPLAPVAVAVPPITARPAVVVASPLTSPAGYVAFVDAVRDPGFDLPGTARRTGVTAYTLGHLSAGRNGCTPTWGGREPAALVSQVGRLRAGGGDAGLAFGGPNGDELSATCADRDRLLAAYQRVIAAYRPVTLDFEVRDSADPAVTARRAAVIARLQREARQQGRPLTITFTLPVTGTGLSSDDQAMLHRTRAAGAEIGTVNLLIPFQPGSPRNIHRLLLAARATHQQLAWVLETTEQAGWRHMGVTPLLVAAQDLGLAEARRLARFRAHTQLAWISVRGATPTDEVARVLTRG